HPDNRNSALEPHRDGHLAFPSAQHARSKSRHERPAWARRRTGGFPVHLQAKPAWKQQHMKAARARQPERSSPGDAPLDKPPREALSLAGRWLDRSRPDRFEAARSFPCGHRPEKTRRRYLHANHEQPSSRYSRIAAPARCDRPLQIQAFRMRVLPVAGPALPDPSEDRARLPELKQVLLRE